MEAIHQQPPVHKISLSNPPKKNNNNKQTNPTTTHGQPRHSWHMDQASKSDVHKDSRTGDGFWNQILLCSFKCRKIVFRFFCKVGSALQFLMLSSSLLHTAGTYDQKALLPFCLVSGSLGFGGTRRDLGTNMRQKVSVYDPEESVLA